MGNNPMMGVSQALEKILLELAPLAQSRPTLQASLHDALGKISAHDIHSPWPVPQAVTSAMDGYAFHSRDLSHAKVELKVIGTQLAGPVNSLLPGQGECIRIMTGAIVPKSCDTVIPMELVESKTDLITFSSSAIRAQSNCKQIGEELQLGAIALAQGTRIGPSQLGLLASLGISQIEVQAPLKIGFLSTGDELVELNQTPTPGAIFDCNRYILFGLIQQLGCEARDYGIIHDRPQAIKDAFLKAAMECDVVISSGGVSVGDADHTKSVLQAIGTINFWSIAMRPGKPMAFGMITQNSKTTPFFGLPGNPIAVLTTFYHLVQPALLALMKKNGVQPPYCCALLQEQIVKKAGRTEFLRGRYYNQNGQTYVEILNPKGMGTLTSMSQANCFVILEEDASHMNALESVQIMPFYGVSS